MNSYFPKDGGRPSAHLLVYYVLPEADAQKLAAKFESDHRKDGDGQTMVMTALELR